MSHSRFFVSDNTSSISHLLHRTRAPTSTSNAEAVLQGSSLSPVSHGPAISRSWLLLRPRTGSGPPKSLPSDLRLSICDGLVGIRVDEPASRLAVLELGSLGRADTAAVDAGTACHGTVSVVNADTRDELRAVASADVPCTLDVPSTAVLSGLGLGAVLCEGHGSNWCNCQYDLRLGLYGPSCKGDSQMLAKTANLTMLRCVEETDVRGLKKVR